ncbi:MAG TPA: hypothetical protein VHT91_49760 [Kofleriaceae bacterium]|jgi:hypothetical protein|nr:hypothetical protein [Kofleriaceae bacterium]
MGIFSRFFQRGQDGNPVDPSAGGDDGDTTDPEIEVIQTAHGSDHHPAPAAAPPEGPAPVRGSSLLGGAPGLTPAFATQASSVVAHSAEPQRSIWDWPGPQPRQRSSASATPPSTASEPAHPTAAESRPPARGGGLPSVPRAATEPAGRVTESGKEPGKEKDVTMAQSPPPASGSASGRGARPASSGSPALPGLPPSPRTAPPATPPGAPAAPASAAPAKPSAAAAPAGPAPAPAARPQPPPAGRPARRAHSDSVTAAFDQVIESEVGDTAVMAAQSVHGVSTVEDLAEVRRVFNDVAAIHVGQVRDVMLELRYGDAQPGWIESTQPALRSLRAMAQQMDLHDLVGALDEFCVAVDAAVTGRARIDDDGKAALLRRYQRLIELIPQAFELDAERDRREPIIVEALLYQIPGVEKRTVEKLFAVGLHRLDPLMHASADEVAVVAGIRAELATAIVDQFRHYRTAASSALAAPDPLAERRALGDLLIMMSVQNDEYNHAATLWTDEARGRKHEARKQREQVFQRIKVALARLGERDLLARLDRLPFNDRIAALDRYLSAAIPQKSQPGKTS